MKFFVLFVLFWGVLLSTALSLTAEGAGQEIPVDQPFGKYEKNESKEELKKWELTPALFGTVTADFLLEKSIDSSLHEAFIFASLVNHRLNCSRAPPLSLC